MIKELEIHSQDLWRRKEPWWRGPLKKGVPFVFITKTNEAYCMTNNSCFKMIRRMQAVHRGKFGNPDVQYNFVIGTNGQVYEARGWEVRPTLPIKYLELQGQSLYIAFVGHFIDKKPPKQMYEAKQDLLEYGVKNNYITSKCLEFYV